MNKKKQLSQTDQALFEDAMQGVKPLPQGNYAPPHLTPKKIPIKRAFEEDESTNYQLSDAQDYQRIQSDEEINYRSNGIQPKLFRKLRAGKIAIEAHLDLHGLTINEARQQVCFFVQNSKVLDKKCIIIVHGKGSIKNPPILKSMINHWLRQIPDVLAFSTAQVQHGGSGAAYVLIKKAPLSDR